MKEYMIEGYSNYMINQIGEIFSYKGASRRKLKTFINKNGYEQVRLYPDIPRSNYKPDMHSVHRLVALTFLKRECETHEVNHKNYDRLDNRLENLEWVTRSQNAYHRLERCK